MNSKTKDHYHFIGIGGIGMGTLASLMLSKGYPVSGSDARESAMTERLSERGAKVSIGHDEGNVNGADVVVFSSAIKENNPEMIKARHSGVTVLRRAELLARLMKNHVGITVAGAHGKTTTTSMIANMLIQSGLEPTTAVGGIIKGAASNAALGAGKYFVAEVDESDGSFLCFQPEYSVITNIDFEHVDYYGTWEKIIESYEMFIGRTKPHGILIVSGEDGHLIGLARKSKRRFTTFGLSSGNDVWARNIRSVRSAEEGQKTQFECVVNGSRSLGTVELSVLGRHNVLNALACVSLGLQLSVSFERIRESLKSYEGVNRRFQFKGEAKGITVVDDYGHHPTEIAATLEAARSLEGRRLVTVFQPHRYTRTKALKKEFIKSLMSAENLIVTDIYAASEPEIEGVNAESLIDGLKADGHQGCIYVKKEDVVEHLVNHAKAGDMVLTLGAGDIYRAGEEFLKRLDGAVEVK